MNKLLSNCCQKPVRTAWSQDFGDEPKGKKPPAGATCFMICDGCNKVCDTHEDSDISKIVGKLQDDLTDEVDKYFPKGECTGRGGAILLVGLAVSFIASALTKAKKEARREALDSLPRKISKDSLGMDDFIRGSNSGIRACENNLKKLKSK